MKVALITGGTRGIGRAIAERFKEGGWRVAVVSRTPAVVPFDLHIQTDLTAEPLQDIIRLTVDKLGRLDLLVNNAGLQRFSDTLGDFDISLRLMARAPYQLARMAAAVMDEGHIINVLSTSAIQGARSISGYIAAKHAALGVTRALALELAPKIHVNAVVPGLINTDMTEDFTQSRRELLDHLIPAHRFGEPSEVADAVWFLAHSSYIYGHMLMVDGGWMVKNG